MKLSIFLFDNSGLNRERKSSVELFGTWARFVFYICNHGNIHFYMTLTISLSLLFNFRMLFEVLMLEFEVECDLKILEFL